jgi:Flp pilus assembly protein TadG
MRGTVFSRLWLGAKSLLRDQRGNAFMLTAAAIVPVVGIVGSGIDIGRGYMTQLRLQQACDAGVLAGRRYMGASAYTDEAEAEAQKMFNFNFPAGIYGSSATTFDSAPQGKSDVVGSATAKLPTAIMHIFGFKDFNLTASCAAKLEISNTDVMLVLDVTGSMTNTTSDGKTRIAGLKDASMVFFDTLTQAEKGDGRLRIGIVPYSNSANVGRILREKNPAWLSNYTILPSRSPVIRYNWSGTNPPTSVTTGTTTNGAWADFLPASGFTETTACSNLTAPADTMPALTTGQDMNKTAYIVDAGNVRRYVTVAGAKHAYFNYRYNYNTTDSTCWLQRRTVTFDHATSPTPSSTPFNNQYRYEDRVFDVSNLKTGGTINVDTGDSGANRNLAWAGCVMERRTSDFGSSTSAPAVAVDMDVDLVPSTDENTKWRMLLPEISFARNASVGNKPSGTGIQTVNSSSVTGSNWQSYEYNWSNGWGVCPAEATKLTVMDSDDRTFFQGKINALQPLGGTYHDAGMVWGVRLLSPTGLFADENAVAPNERPISRHIIFMTDGDMAPNMGNLSFQGYEYLMRRVGGSIDTSDSQLTDRHNNRFLQLCAAAKARNITIWVIGFGTALNTQLTTCSTPGKAYQTASAAQLKTIFASIAGQISRLRLSQ